MVLLLLASFFYCECNCDYRLFLLIYDMSIKFTANAIRTSYRMLKMTVASSYERRSMLLIRRNEAYSVTMYSY